MLNREQRRELELQGVVCLRGAAPAERVAAFREEVLRFIAANGIQPTGGGAYLAIPPSRTKRIARSHGFSELWGEGVVEAIDDVLGAERWTLPKFAGQILALNWPQPARPWQLTAQSWHLDYPAPGAATTLPGLQLFLLLDRVEPRGGATLVAAGLPRLVDAIRQRRGPQWEGRSADVRGAVTREVPWFRELRTFRDGEDRVARFMEKATEFEGSPLHVVELCGEPGDVWLMHPWMLHTFSTNCRERPRMVLTERIRAR
jgi:hypothetical protein